MAKAKSKAEKPSTADAPKDLKPNDVTRVHVNRDIRMPKALRDKLPLEPGERWKFSIVSVKQKEFTIKAEKI